MTPRLRASAVILLMASCRAATQTPGIFLLDRVQERPGEVFIFEFSRNHELRRTLLTTAGAAARFEIRVPEKAKLRFGVALPFNVTDGALAEVLIGERIVYSRFIDPGRSFEDRRWHDEVVDLADYAGKTVSITFRAAAGPRGDAVGDWVGWSSPTIDRS